MHRLTISNHFEQQNEKVLLKNVYLDGHSTEFGLKGQGVFHPSGAFYLGRGTSYTERLRTSKRGALFVLAVYLSVEKSQYFEQSRK